MTGRKSDAELDTGSGRGFGLVFAAVFAIIGLWPLTGDGALRLWALVVAAVLLLAALTAPKILAPLNRLWLRFGALLGRAATPLVMAVLFYGTVLPTGLVLRALGRDPLRRRPDPEAASYWIRRDPPGPEPTSMKNQF